MKKFIKILNVVCVLSLAIMLWSGQAQANPLFSLDTYSEWNTAVGGVGPGGLVRPVIETYPALEAHYGVPGVEYVYVTPTITAMTAAGSGEPGDGLLMEWGDLGADPGIPQVAAWEYVYDVDPDLTGKTLHLSVTPPTGIMSVSLTLSSLGGGWASWTWDVPPLLANLPNMITIDPTLGAQAGSATFFQSSFDVTQVISIQADEKAVGSAFWNTNFPTGPPTTGSQPWNYWSALTVTPEPTTICLLGFGILGLLRKRRG